MKDVHESAPALCCGCSTFYGSHATQGFCSACWKARQAAASDSAAPVPLVPSAPEPAPPPAIAVPAVSAAAEAAAEAAAPPADAPSTSVAAPAPAPADDGRPPQPPGRCFCCRKKVGLASGFKCRCDYTFCAAHRLPEHHECGFDFRGAGKVALAAANPVIKADKIAKI